MTRIRNNSVKPPNRTSNPYSDNSVKSAIAIRPVTPGQDPVALLLGRRTSALKFRLANQKGETVRNPSIYVKMKVLGAIDVAEGRT